MKGRGHCAGCGFEGEMDDFLKHSCSEENKRLRAELAEWRELFNECDGFEWYGTCLGQCSTPEKEGEGFCLFCSNHESGGHAPDCKLGKLLGRK